jgi:hypothetical protein
MAIQRDKIIASAEKLVAMILSRWIAIDSVPHEQQHRLVHLGRRTNEGYRLRVYCHFDRSFQQKTPPAAKPRGVDDCRGGHAPLQSGAATPSSSSTLMGLAALTGSVT